MYDWVCVWDWSCDGLVVSIYFGLWYDFVVGYDSFWFGDLCFLDF